MHVHARWHACVSAYMRRVWAWVVRECVLVWICVYAFARGVRCVFFLFSHQCKSPHQQLMRACKSAPRVCEWMCVAVSFLFKLTNAKVHINNWCDSVFLNGFFFSSTTDVCMQECSACLWVDACFCVFFKLTNAKVHINSWCTQLGSCSSIYCMSFENLFNMRPTGVALKKPTKRRRKERVNGNILGIYCGNSGGRERDCFQVSE